LRFETLKGATTLKVKEQHLALKDAAAGGLDPVVDPKSKYTGTSLLTLKASSSTPTQFPREPLPEDYRLAPSLSRFSFSRMDWRYFRCSKSEVSHEVMGKIITLSQFFLLVSSHVMTMQKNL